MGRSASHTSRVASDGGNRPDRLWVSSASLAQREEVIMAEASGISFRDAATVFVVRNVGESVAHYRDVLALAEGLGVSLVVARAILRVGGES